MATGDPTGADLTSGTTNGDTLPATPTTEDREITFSSPVALISGYKYAIVVRALSAGGAESVDGWGSTAGYSGGKNLHSVNSGSTWSDGSGDAWFITKASGVTKDSYQPSPVSFVFGPIGINGTFWRTQTFTTTSAYSISSVVLKIGRTATPGTVTVSIRKVEGESYYVFTPPAPTGENNMLTVRRLIAVANDKFWYESI